MTLIDSDKVISTILKHNTKVTSYKIALLRAINHVVLTHLDLRTYQSDVAVPFKLLAEFWIAHYWPYGIVWMRVINISSAAAATVKGFKSFLPTVGLCSA